jgi:tRNA(fMet)-specific endonuclease VapC
MMILLDTDHFSVVTDVRHSNHAILLARLQTSGDQDFGTSIISVEEQLQGWLAAIRRRPDIEMQARGYVRLASYLDAIKRWKIVAFDEHSVAEFKRLREEKVRIGTQDLKIASIALAKNMLVLSANLRDFRKVPGLRVASWPT